MTNTAKSIASKAARWRNSFIALLLSLSGGRKRRLSSAYRLLLCLAICTRLAQGQSSDPDVRFSQGDINDSAMLSLTVPLGKLKGRELDLPISLSYSSMVWRIDQLGKIANLDLSATQSVTQAIYAEHSISGWKSTLDLPKIEFPKQSDTYDYRAKPYPTSTLFNGCFGYRIPRVYIHMPDGSTHEMRKSDSPYLSLSIDMLGTFYAVDGSRLRYDSTGVDTGTLYMPDGTRYVLGHPTSSIIDRNGNTQTFDENTRQWTDTLGRVIFNPLPATPLEGPQDYAYNLPGLNGASVTYTFRWRNLSSCLTPDDNGNLPLMKYVATHYLPNPNLPPTNTNGSNKPLPQPTGFESMFQTFTPEPLDPNLAAIPIVVVGKGQSGGQPFNPVVLQEIALPDGTKYSFSYNAYGEISKVTYPTTAFEKYEFAGPLAGFDDQKQPYVQAQRRVTSRKLSISGLGNDILEWSYRESGSVPLGNPVDLNSYRVRSIIAPDKTRTEIYQYHLNANDGTGKQYWNFDFANALEGMVFQKLFYSSSPDGLGGQLLRREITQYDQKVNTYQWNVTCGQTPFTKMISAFRNPRPIKKVSIILEGAGPALAQTSTFGYDISDDMRTGVDQVLTTDTHFAVIDNATAQSGTLNQIPVGQTARTTETTYLNGPTDPNGFYRARNILGLVTSRTVKAPDGATVSRSEMRYDEGDYAPEFGRALPTSSREWDSTKGAAGNPDAYLTTHAKFDLYGNRVEATDAMGNVVVTEFDPTHHAFPVKTITPIPDPNPSGNPDGQAHGSQTAFESTTTYDFQTGLVLSMTDIDGQTTQMEYNDLLLRPTRVIPPAGGGQVITEYGLGTTESNRFVKVKTQIDALNWKEAIRFYDGVGRTIKTQLVSSSGDIFSETRYDNMGRVQQVSSPYRVGETKFWTSAGYDDLSRVITVTTPDGAPMQTSYGLSTIGVIGTTKTNRDQAGKKRSGVTDSLGRMFRVIEDPDHQNLVTDYVFDTLGNLRKTIQGEQMRYFMCDSLGRIIYSKQPEQEVNTSLVATDSVSGNTQWSQKLSYDDNSNNVLSTDARGVSVTATYDRLNRMIFRDYSDATPDVSFFHDGTGLGVVPSNSRGQLTKVSSSVTETRYPSYDNLGRVKSSQQITNGVTYGFADYSYDFASNLISKTYPSGRIVKTTFDSSGDLIKVESKKDSSNPLETYLDQVKYDAAGSAIESRLGNGLWQTAAYNTRLQLVRIGLGSSNTDTSLLKIDYDYGTSAQNNGALRQQRITAPGSAQPIIQDYAYDYLNRLQSSTETFNGGALSWKQTFTYDRFGNRRFDPANTTTLNGTQQVANPLINTSDNRFSSGQGYTYDKSGNLIQDATGQRFVYDAEGRQIQFFSQTNGSSTPDVTYQYDGEGRRVKKTAAQSETVFVYDASSQLVAEYSNQISANPKRSYITTDHIGSPRIVTDQTGQVVSRRDYMSFGEEVPASLASRPGIVGYGLADEIRQQFTGHQRDTESGLDYAKARYYSSRHGRFTSPDPLTASATIRNPQTFNRYAYVLNNPTNFIDPDGLMAVDASQGWGDVASGFWGNSFDFAAQPTQDHIAEAMVRHDLIISTGYDLAFGCFRGDVEITYTMDGYSITSTLHRPTIDQVEEKMESMRRTDQLVAQNGGSPPQTKKTGDDIINGIVCPPGTPLLKDVIPCKKISTQTTVRREDPQVRQQKRFEECISNAFKKRLWMDIKGGALLYASLRTARSAASKPTFKRDDLFGPGVPGTVGLSMLQSAKATWDADVLACKGWFPLAKDTLLSKVQ